MLKLETIVAGYGRAEVLRSIDLEVKPGECVAVVGRSGAGKTTLAKVLLGLVPARSGSVIHAGKDITDWPSFRRSRAGIGYVPSENGLFSQLTVAENLETGIFGSFKRSSYIPAQIVERFPMLQNRSDDFVSDLSASQRTQLSVARALVDRPSILIVDEPSEKIERSVWLSILAGIGELAIDNQVGVLLLGGDHDEMQPSVHRCLQLHNGVLSSRYQTERADHELDTDSRQFYGDGRTEKRCQVLPLQRSRI